MRDGARGGFFRAPLSHRSIISRFCSTQAPAAAGGEMPVEQAAPKSEEEEEEEGFTGL